MDTSASTITTMGVISDEVYNNNKAIVDYFKDDYDADGNKIVKFIQGTTYKVINHTDDSTLSGFEALLLQDTKTGKYVIAFRGTEQTSAIDWITDLLSGASNVNLQYENALAFVNKVLGKTYNGVTVTKENLTLTGHSLGGILTQQVGATLGIQGYAFNPWGANALVKYPPNGPLNVLARVLEAVGVYNSSTESWAKNNIFNISYNDSGTVNGDILSNTLTGLISDHLGAYLPIVGTDEGTFTGHRMPILNAAIAHYNDVLLSHFTKDTTFANLSVAYLSVGNYEKVENTFTDLNIYGATNLTFNFLTNATSETMSSNAKTDKAELYALLNLNPFTIEGNLPAYNTINPNDYSDMFLMQRADYLFYTLDKQYRYDNVPKLQDFKDFSLGSDYDLTQNAGVGKVLFGGDDNNTVKAVNNFLHAPQRKCPWGISLHVKKINKTREVA